MPVAVDIGQYVQSVVSGSVYYYVLCESEISFLSIARREKELFGVAYENGSVGAPVPPESGGNGVIRAERAARHAEPEKSYEHDRRYLHGVHLP